MPLKSYFFRDRAVSALHTMMHGGVACLLQSSDVPVALSVRSAGLVIVAGDSDEPLDWTRLKPFARAQQLNVVATYVAPMRAGHRFLFDVVLQHAKVVTLYPEYRLWKGETGNLALIPEASHGPSFTLDAAGVKLARRSPCPAAPQRTVGLARAQASLIKLIFDGTPYSVPLDRNIGI